MKEVFVNSVVKNKWQNVNHPHVPVTALVLDAKY